MKKMIALIMVLTMTLSINVHADDVDLTPASVFSESKSDAMASAVDDFNEIRQRYELPEVTVNPVLKDMAQLHSKYMAYHDILTSIESSDNSYFRGRYPWDRASYFKYDKDYIYEFVQEGSVNYQNGMDMLMADPVSRYFLLDPMYTEIGMAVVDDYFTFELGGDESSLDKNVIYPENGDTNIPITWKGDSYDELIEIAEVNPIRVGYPITATFYGEEIDQLVDVKVTLTNLTTGSEMPVAVIEPGDYYLLKNTLTILPLSNYSYDTTYEAHIEFLKVVKEGTDRRFYKTIRFTTGDLIQTDQVQSPYITRGEFTENLVKSMKYPLVEPLFPKFTDVSLSSTQGKYIYTANYQGLINGLSATEFRPELNITREQAYIIFVRAFENDNNEVKRSVYVTDPDQLMTYKDEDEISEWAYEYVLKANELGIVFTSDSALLPGAYLTEEDFRLMLERYEKTTEGMIDQ